MDCFVAFAPRNDVAESAPPRAVIPRGKRGIQYAAAVRFYHWGLGVLDRPLSQAMTTESVAPSQSPDVRPHSRGADCARVVQKSFASKTRAQGMPGARCTRSLVCEV
jgi:hypothetical protein